MQQAMVPGRIVAVELIQYDLVQVMDGSSGTGHIGCIKYRRLDQHHR